VVQWEVPRAPTSILVLLELGLERGVPEEVCLRGTRLVAERLCTSGAEVTARQEQSVIRNLMAATGGGVGLGVEAGSRYHLTSFGFWGFALVSSPTLRDAVDLGIRFVDLTYALSRVRLRREGDDAQLVFDAPDVPESLMRFAVERDAAVIATLHRELFSMTLPVRRARLAFPEPTQFVRYAEVIGATPEFDAPETVLTFDAAVLDLPMPQANDHAQELAQAQCRDLLERGRARTGVAGRVRDLLVARPGDPPNAEQVARTLTMSSRTLRERLADEGTSYRELVDEIRERLAEEMLGGGLTVGQTAERLGYIEVSSFSHAFRRWKGMGPRAWRAGRPAAR